MPLASDAVAFFLPILRRGHWNQPSSLERHEQGQERAFGAFWNARTSSLLVIPTLLYLHNQDREQKTTFAYLARTSPRGRVLFLISVCMFPRVSVFFVFCSHVSVCVFQFVCWCARSCVFFYLWV